MPSAALHTGRAVAFLIVASGISGVAAAMAPSFDTRWIFVVAVGLVAAVDGWLIGFAAAAAAVLCYEAMAFGTISLAPARDGALLGFGIAAAIAARTVTESFPRRIPAARTPLLLTATPAKTDVQADTDLRDTLRQRDEQHASELAAARQDAERATAAAAEIERQFARLREDSGRERVEVENTWAQRLAQREEELAAASLRASAEAAKAALIAKDARDHEAKGEELKRQLAETRKAFDSSSRLIERLQAEREQWRGRDLEGRLASLESELAAARTSEQSAHAQISQLEHERDRLEERLQAEVALLRSELTAASARKGSLEAIAAVQSEHEATRTELERTRARLESEVQRLSRELAEARSSQERSNSLLSADHAQERTRLEEELAEARGELASLRGADEDARRLLGQLVREHEDEKGRLQGRIEQLLEQLNAARTAREDARSDIARLELGREGVRGADDPRLAQLQDDLDRNRRALAEGRAESERLRAENEQLRARFDARVGELEAQLAEAAAGQAESHAQLVRLAGEREEAIAKTANARVAAIQEQLETAERTVVELRQSEAAARDQLRRMQLELSDRYNEELAVARAAAEQSRIEAETLSTRLEELKNETVVMQRAHAEEMKSLARTTLEIRKAREEDVRSAETAAETARAESTRLSERVADLERALAEEKPLREAHERSEAIRAEAIRLAARVAELEDAAGEIEPLREAAERSARDGDAARIEAARLGRRLAELEPQVASASLAREEAERHAAEAQAARDALTAAESRVHAAVEEAAHTVAALAALRREHDALSQQHGAVNEQMATLTARIAELEQTAGSHASRADEAAARINELAQANETLQLEATELRREREVSEELSSKVAQLTEKLGRAEARADDATTQSRTLLTRVRELERLNAELRSSAAAADEKTREAAALQRDAEARVAQAVSAAATAEAEAAALRSNVAELEGDRSQLRQIADDALSEAGAAERRADVAEQRVASLLERVGQLQRLVAEREAGPDPAALAARIAELERAMRQAEEESARHLHQALAASTAAEMHAAGLQERIAILQKEHDAKLETIVTHLASDHEADLGQALLEREGARAELRAAQMRLAQMAKEEGELRRALEEERARHQAMEAEWSEKLQTIVSHLASDHEVDVGQAIAQREEARAEVRRLNSRIAAMTRSLEEREGSGMSAGVDAAPPRRARVLLVHHDARMRAIAQRELTASGYDITTAEEGMEALRLAIAESPDVVVAEAVMQKMGGRELVRLLKARPETSNIKFVLVNSSDAPQEGSELDFTPRTTADVQALKATLESVLSARAR